MYSSYSAAAFSLRAAKPSFHTHSSYLPLHHYHHDDDGDGHHRELLPLNPHLTPRFLLDGYLLRHLAHLLLTSRLRPPPPPHPPHCYGRRVAARCCCSGGGGGGIPVLGHVSWRLEGCGCRCCGHATGWSDLGAVCRRLEARGCRCGGSVSGRLGLGAACGRRDAPKLVGRAVRQEVWEYEGGERPRRGCSMECHGDWDEEEEDECGLAQWEVPGRLPLSRRRCDEDEDDDRCRDCRRRKGVESDYYDEDEYGGWQTERSDANGRHCRFRDSDRRRWEQRDCHDDEDDLDLRRRRKKREGRERRDFEFEDAVDMRRVGTRRYGEDARKYDRRRERRDYDFEDAVDVKRVGASRYTEDDRRFDWRTERRDFEIDDEVDVRTEGSHRSNDGQRYVTWHQRRIADREGEDVSLLGSRRWHDQEYDYDDQDIAEQRYHSGGRFQKSARSSAFHEDDSKRSPSSRNTFDTRLARKEENSASRVRWHDNVDRRAEQTSEERDRRYSSSIGQSNDEKDEYDYDDARLVRVRDSRTGTQDVRVITEDDTSLASSSKITSILKHRSNVDQQVAAHKDESRNSSQKIMEISEVRGNNTERDSRTQSYHQDDRRKQIENRPSSLQSSVKMANDRRRQIDQHDEVDEQVALTDSRKKSKNLTDIEMDSTHNVSRASHSQRNYDEVNQTDIDDGSTSLHNITHVTRDKKRYVNQQVIHETGIDVQNVTHVDVSKVRASDISMSRSSQNHSETRSDVNSTSNVSLIDRARGQQEQIHQNKVCAIDSAIVRGSESHLETGVYDRVHSTSVTNVVDSTKDRQEQVELTKAYTNNASTSAVNTIGSVKEQIDLTKIHASYTMVVNSSQGLDTKRDNQAHMTSALNLVDRARESRNNSDLQMTQGSSIERSDQVSTKFSESSQESRERLARLEETERLMQHNLDLNSQQAGTTKISDDKEITSLRMESTEEGSSIVNADMAQRGTMMGSSGQQIRSETTSGSSIPSGSSARQSVKESVLESAARLEKSSTFHVGQFVDELQKGVSDADTTLTKKNEKPIMEGITRSSSRSKMRGPSYEMWDVQSGTSQETFKTADKDEGSSADGATNSASQTPKNETSLARKVHKSLWAYVADIVRLGWIQRGESRDSSNKSVKKSSSSNSQSTEGWLSSQKRDNDGTQKKNGSITPKEQQLMKSHTGESESRVASTLKEESLHTGNNVPQVGRSKGDFVARSSKDDVHVSGERAKQSDVGASPKGNIIGGFAEDGRSTLVDVTIGHFSEHDAATSSRITAKGSTEINTGKGVFADTSSMTINTEEAGRNCDADDWRYDPSGAKTPYHQTQTQAMVPHENTSAAILESPELPTGGFTRFEEKIVIQEPPEVIRTERKDAELKRMFQRNKQVLKETFDEWEEAYQHDAEQRKADELLMREALLEAQRAADIWEVPVGAVLVQNGEIIARGCNLVEDLRDSTAHAEIVCIREASNKLKTWRLADTTLYVTLEPCAMCAGAILQARVDTVVWGAPNKLLGADGSWVRLFPGDGQTSTLDPANQNQTAQTSGPVHPFHPKITIRRGVLSYECSEIMQQFFHLRRKKKQKPESPPLTHARLPGHNHPIKFFTKMHNMFGTIFCM